MLTITRAGFLAAAACSLLPLPMRAALAATDQQGTVDKARGTIEDLKRDPQFGTAKDLIHRARPIIIVPRLFKAGFFVGGEGGTGVMLVRGNSGWSSPAFYTLGSASFGLQIGLETSELILFIMSQKALTAVMQNQFKIGVGAGIAVVTLGTNVEGATTSAAGADIVTWASSSGAYAGVSLNGSILSPSADDNRAYYGRAITTQQIIAGAVDRDPAGAALRQAVVSVR